MLISKPTVVGFGLNLQHCAHQTFFPSHSFEQWYQSVRRCWRFGQTRPVTVDVVSSECEAGVLGNLNEKARKADLMFRNLVDLMNDQLRIVNDQNFHQQERIPAWAA